MRERCTPVMVVAHRGHDPIVLLQLLSNTPQATEISCGFHFWH